MLPGDECSHTIQPFESKILNTAPRNFKGYVKGPGTSVNSLSELFD